MISTPPTNHRISTQGDGYLQGLREERLALAYEADPESFDEYWLGVVERLDWSNMTNPGIQR